MLLPVLYMESLDEIDSENLSRGEIQVRQIARNMSVFPAFCIYALFLPLLMILYYCYEPAKEAFQGFIFTFILKPIRWVCYKIVFIICDAVRKLNS
ncbi:MULTISPECIES: hypothetical protein [Calothrix]|uniref:Uncharacterized protein n=2 Tax=Calothrix TaxID=1186 RepID=A0ABR8AFN7_9CYAN|nr:MULTISPECIES: hypothetical protein [Calothrix]MBD2198734.1 hypothetical protein [Calothrix parietina FACHB-288]MBD2228618.1 hypothetical protein [Calothrix anomala FACHB-343]